MKTQKQLMEGQTAMARKRLISNTLEDSSITDGETEVQREKGLDQDPQPDPLSPRVILLASSLVHI